MRLKKGHFEKKKRGVILAILLRIEEKGRRKTSEEATSEMQPRYSGDMDMVVIVDVEGKKFEFGIYIEGRTSKIS